MKAKPKNATEALEKAIAALNGEYQKLLAKDIPLAHPKTKELLDDINDLEAELELLTRE